MPSADDVARWMLQQLKAQGVLYQDEAASEIATRFGEEFVYDNENGNLAIDKRVLAAFLRITEKTVVWDTGERFWRFREQYDGPGRRAD